MKSRVLKSVCVLAVVPIAVGISLCARGLTVQPTSCDLGKVRHGRVLHRKFTIKNPSIFPARIESAIPACECTHAKLTNKHIPPFGKVYMDVTFDTKGFRGKATRFIDIEVANPHRQNLTVTFDVDARGGPEKGLEKILFSQPCDKCHAKPGVGKTGRELYEAVCQICHTNGKAVSPIRRGKWYPSYTKITRDGLPCTSTPATPKKCSGKLTDEQIESIKAYFSQH
ncbi:MAG: DUF1573 domain-containing protein [Armatimonadota bacterium]|nr:DUF1573 domain-containing protein [bacterium]